MSLFVTDRISIPDGELEESFIRASGPALTQPFIGFPAASVIADPKLQLFDSSSTSIATNDNWGGTAALSAA